MKKAISSGLALRLALVLVGSALVLGGQASALFEFSGLDFLHRNSATTQKYLVETMGGGAALLDYDADGRLDVFLVNGGKLDDPVQLPADFRRRDPAYWNRLYKQNANGTFTDVTVKAGLSQAANVYGMGAGAGDFDNDGLTDLYVTGYGGNTLYRNTGGGVFADVTKESGTGVGGWSVSAAWLDYDNDGKLDLFVARYLDWDLGRNILCGSPFHAYCRPDKFEGVTNVLLRNEGGGKFRDVSVESGIGAVKGKGMGVAVSDYDGDGFVDVFVANDGMEQHLFHNERNGKFVERGLEAGVALSDDAKTFAGMGASFGDFDNDGDPDLVVTNLALEKFALYRNEGGGRFAYASLESGLAALTARSSGWGVGLADFDNDGWKDVFAAQGHVLDNVERIHSGLRYREVPAVYRNRGDGRFEAAAVSAGLPAVAGRGVAFGDLDNDGDVDAVMFVLGGRPVVLKNRAVKPGLTVRLVGVRANRDGVGAVVRAGEQMVEATAAGSYLSSSDGRVHLAGSPERIEVLWPGSGAGGGRRQVVTVPVGRRVIEVKEEVP